MTPSPKSLEEAREAMIGVGVYFDTKNDFDLAIERCAQALDRREAEAVTRCLKRCAKIAEEAYVLGKDVDQNPGAFKNWRRGADQTAEAIATAIRALIKPREGS